MRTKEAFYFYIKAIKDDERYFKKVCKENKKKGICVECLKCSVWKHKQRFINMLDKHNEKHENILWTIFKE